MGELALAAVLAVTILLASTISIEIGLAVALIELAAGRGRREPLHDRDPRLAVVRRHVRRHRAHVPRRAPRWTCPSSGGSGGPASRSARCRSPRRSRGDGDGLLGRRLDAGAGRDRRARALDHEPGGRLRGAGGDRPQPLGDGQADHGGDVRDRHPHRPRALGRSSSRRTCGSSRSRLASVLAIWGLPRIAPWFFGRYGDRIIEPEIKLVFAAMFALMYLGEPGRRARPCCRCSCSGSP